MYARLRHPLYVGSFLLGFGLSVAGGQWWFPLVFSALVRWVYSLTIRAEERELESGSVRTIWSYREQVPAFFPRFRPYHSDDPSPGFRVVALPPKQGMAGGPGGGSWVCGAPMGQDDLPGVRETRSSERGRDCGPKGSSGGYGTDQAERMKKENTMRNRLMATALCCVTAFGCGPAQEEEMSDEGTPFGDREEAGPVRQVRLTGDLSQLTDAERAMIPLLIEAADAMTEIFWQESYGDRDEFLATLDDPAMKAYGVINFGPWDRIDGNAPFVPGVGPETRRGPLLSRGHDRGGVRGGGGGGGGWWGGPEKPLHRGPARRGRWLCGGALFRGLCRAHEPGRRPAPGSRRLRGGSGAEEVPGAAGPRPSAPTTIRPVTSPGWK